MKRSGRPPAINDQEGHELERIVDKNRHSSLKEITEKFTLSTGLQVCPRTVRKYLHKKQIHSRVSARKPFINENQRKVRLEWCDQRRNWTDEWSQVIWSDEFRFTLFKSDGRTRVWRRPDEKYKIV